MRTGRGRRSLQVELARCNHVVNPALSSHQPSPAASPAAGGETGKLGNCRKLIRTESAFVLIAHPQSEDKISIKPLFQFPAFNEYLSLCVTSKSLTRHVNV